MNFTWWIGIPESLMDTDSAPDVPLRNLVEGLTIILRRSKQWLATKCYCTSELKIMLLTSYVSNPGKHLKAITTISTNTTTTTVTRPHCGMPSPYRSVSIRVCVYIYVCAYMHMHVYIIYAYINMYISWYIYICHN